MASSKDRKASRKRKLDRYKRLQEQRRIEDKIREKKRQLKEMELAKVTPVDVEDTTTPEYDRSILDDWDELERVVEQHGSVRATSRAIKIPESTIRSRLKKLKARRKAMEYPPLDRYDVMPDVVDTTLYDGSNMIPVDMPGFDVPIPQEVIDMHTKHRLKRLNTAKTTKPLAALAGATVGGGRGGGLTAAQFKDLTRLIKKNGSHAFKMLEQLQSIDKRFAVLNKSFQKVFGNAVNRNKVFSGGGIFSTMLLEEYNKEKKRTTGDSDAKQDQDRLRESNKDTLTTSLLRKQVNLQRDILWRLIAISNDLRYVNRWNGGRGRGGNGEDDGGWGFDIFGKPRRGGLLGRIPGLRTAIGITAAITTARDFYDYATLSHDETLAEDQKSFGGLAMSDGMDYGSTALKAAATGWSLAGPAGVIPALAIATAAFIATKGGRRAIDTGQALAKAGINNRNTARRMETVREHNMVTMYSNRNHSGQLNDPKLHRFAAASIRNELADLVKQIHRQKVGSVEYNQLLRKRSILQNRREAHMELADALEEASITGDYTKVNILIEKMQNEHGVYAYANTNFDKAKFKSYLRSDEFGNHYDRTKDPSSPFYGMGGADDNDIFNLHGRGTVNSGVGLFNRNQPSTPVTPAIRIQQMLDEMDKRTKNPPPVIVSAPQTTIQKTESESNLVVSKTSTHNNDPYLNLQHLSGL